MIFLIRHGKPEFPYTDNPRKWIRGSEFNRLIRLYDEAALHTEWNRARAATKDPHTVTTIRASNAYSSDLLRAKETATLLLNGSAFAQDSMFREVPLPDVPNWFWLPSYWHLMLARILWYLGKRSDEPKNAAINRAKMAADTLEREAHQRPVSLFSHGFFLYILSQELRRRGWHCDLNRPMRYLEIRTFLRKSS